ncbi:MAG TPA: NUDIX domain-containing protein [Patescibacteria group bacterium]
MAFPRFFRNANEELIEYDGSPISWRVSVYALVIKNDQLLIIKDKTEKLHDIPGGGVELTENLEEALKREALEEAGAHITMGALVHLAEGYFYHSKEKKFFKTLQLFYEAELAGELEKPHHQTSEWVKFVPLREVNKYPLPAAVKDALKKIQS